MAHEHNTVLKSVLYDKRGIYNLYNILAAVAEEVAAELVSGIRHDDNTAPSRARP